MPKCHKPKASGLSCCAEHRCSHEGSERKSKARGSYCSDHTCEMSKCYKPKAHGLPCCRKHRCYESSCTKTGGWVARGEDGASGCEEHYWRCQRGNCPEPAEYLDDEAEGGVLHLGYCSSHRCKVFDCCNEQLGNDYCGSLYRQCIVGGCELPAEWPQVYCATRSCCIVNGCPGSRPCTIPSHHTNCPTPGCHDAVNPPGRFCFIHQWCRYASRGDNRMDRRRVKG